MNPASDRKQENKHKSGLSAKVSTFASDIFALNNDDKVDNSATSTNHTEKPSGVLKQTSSLTNSKSNNQQSGMLAKQSLLAKMYQSRSARATAQPNKQTQSSPTTAASKRVFSNESPAESKGLPTQSQPTKTDNSAVSTSLSMSVDSLLHNSCKLYPTNVDIVRSALLFDPEAIRRQVHVTPAPDAAIRTAEQPTTKRPKLEQHCVYPINIALQHKASADVIQLLAETGPDVLVLPDGPSQASSLAIALSSATCRDLATLKLLLAANPQQAAVTDFQNATPLHLVASLPTVTLELVKLVYKAHPAAVLQTNLRGDTPVQVAERNPYCAESIVDYLQEQAYEPFEDKAVHMSDQELDKLVIAADP